MIPVVVAVAVLAVFVVSVWGLPEELVFFKRFEDIDRSAGRLPYHMAGVEAFKESPLVGVGSDRFLDFVQQYKETGRPSAHMVYLSWLAKYGAIGASVYLFFLLAPVGCAVSARTLPGWLRFFVAASFGALLVMYFAYDYFEAQVFLYLVFGVAWSFCVNPVPAQENRKVQSAP